MCHQHFVTGAADLHRVDYVAGRIAGSNEIYGLRQRSPKLGSEAMLVIVDFSLRFSIEVRKRVVTILAAGFEERSTKPVRARWIESL